MLSSGRCALIDPDEDNIVCIKSKIRTNPVDALSILRLIRNTEHGIFLSIISESCRVIDLVLCS